MSSTKHSRHYCHARSRYRWRGDILRALWHRETGKLHAAPAEALGFTWLPEKSDEPAPEQAPSQQKTAFRPPTPPPQIIPDKKRPRLAFICHMASEFHGPAELENHYVPDAKADLNQLIPAKPGTLKLQPLARWSSLWPWLHEVLGHKVNGHKVDIPALMRQVLRQQALQRLPKQSLRRWADGAIFILDFSQRLLPLRRDMQDLMQQLLRERGASGLDAWVIEQGPYSDYYDFFARRRRQSQAPGLGSKPIVICSDLGFYETPTAEDKPASKGEAHAWREYGAWFMRRYKQRPWVLCPCPPDLWHQELGEYFRLVYWDKHSKISTQVTAVPTQLPSGDRAVAMLTRAASAVRVEAHLLRALRLQAQPALDVGHEIAAWQSPLVRQTPRGFAFTREALAQLESGFAALSKAEQKRIANLVQRAHSYLDSDVRLEEALHQSLLTNDNSAKQILDYLLHEKGGNKPGDAQGSPETQAWLARVCQRVPHSGRLNHQAAYEKLCDSLAEQRDQQGRTQLPQGLNPRAWYSRNAQGDEQILAVRGLAQGQLVLQTYNQDAALPEDCLASLLIRDNQVLVYKGLHTENLAAGAAKPETAAEVAPQIVKLHEPQALNFPQAQSRLVVLGNDTETLTLQDFNRPGWAKSLSRRDGELVAEYAQGNHGVQSEEKAHWCQPGIYPLQPSKEILSQETFPLEIFQKETFSIQQGFFWQQQAYLAFKNAGGFVKPEWASAFGVDDYGIYADLQLGKVTQRFRWIRPGSFLMGSPANEPERNENETLHRVTLTKDFWLAETACTQGFWQEVMGKNPSKFKEDEQSKNLPVENISWHDCQTMLSELNKRVPQLSARLPTEAEWEYACRAGTTTVFSFGDELSTGRANYNGNFPYNYQEKGEYRKQTIAVKAFAPNPWGLYQMHGNVLEWCKDWYGAYPEIEVTDPSGPEEGENRVLRGGGWYLYGWGLRAAFRGRHAPDLAVNLLHNAGLRLALG